MSICWEDKRDVCMQKLISFFSNPNIMNLLLFCLFYLTLTRRCSETPALSLSPNGNKSLLFKAVTAAEHKTATQLLTNSSCNLRVQTQDFIILLISSFLLWIICWLLSSLLTPSPNVVKTHQESISRTCPCVSQSKSGASSSSHRPWVELFTSHWCRGWPAVFFVNYSFILSP